MPGHYNDSIIFYTNAWFSICEILYLSWKMFIYVLVCVTTNGTFSLKAFWDTFQRHTHTHLVHIHSRSDTHTHIPWNDIVQGWRNVMCIKGSQIPFKWALVKLAQILLCSRRLAAVLLCLETKYYKYMCPSLFWRISTSPWILSK